MALNLTARLTAIGQQRFQANQWQGIALPASWFWYLVDTSPALTRASLTLDEATLVTAGQALARSAGVIDSAGLWDGVTPPSPPFLGAFTVFNQLSYSSIGAPTVWGQWVLADNAGVENDREIYLIGDAGGDQTIPTDKSQLINIQIQDVVP